MNIYDDTTELYYLNSRYYNPEDGRFITEDTYTGEYFRRGVKVRNRAVGA